MGGGYLKSYKRRTLVDIFMGGGYLKSYKRRTLVDIFMGGRIFEKLQTTYTCGYFYGWGDI